MTRVGLEKDERWPDFAPRDPDCCVDVVVEVDEGTLSRWRRARREYDRAQNEMRQAYYVACERDGRKP